MASPDGCSQRVSCLSGAPSAGLALDADAPPVITVNVRDSQNNPVLSGSPFFAGSISVLFSLDQAGVGVSAGFANELGADRLTAFDRDGNVLASIVNDALGFSFLALVSDDLSNQIAGVQLTGTELSAGFAAENLLFGEGDQLVGSDNGNPTASVPEPSNLGLLAFALIGIVLVRRKYRLS